MSYFIQLAKVLKDHPRVEVPKSLVDPIIKPIADSIFPCDIRNSQRRSYEQVFRDCSNVVGEFALESVLLSIGELAERNPLPFNHRNSESFKYDVVHYCNHNAFKCEFKRMGGKWFSMADNKITTYVKYCKTLDVLVTGYVNELDDNYIVEFSLVVNSKTFENYWRPSFHKKNNSYYNHFEAIKNGDCDIIKLMNIELKD